MPFTVMLTLCLLVLAGRVIDLHFFTEKTTGFVTKGPAWLRYGILLAVAALSYLLSRRAALKPRALLHRCTPLGICMIVAGTALAAVGLSAVAPLLQRGAAIKQYADCFIPLISAVWFWRYGAKAFAIPGGRSAHPATAIGGIVPLFYFGGLLVSRFAIAPAAVVRLGCTFRVLSAAAALLFFVVFLKVFITPGEPVGHALFATGINVFLLGTCTELFQAGFEMVHGTGSIRSVLIALSMACVGVCGLACAWYATGSDVAKKE